MLCSICGNNVNGKCAAGKCFADYADKGLLCDEFISKNKPIRTNRVEIGIGDTATSAPVQKPTLGCSPYYVNISARVTELCDAIKRCSTEKGYADRIRLWCKEIGLLVVMNDMLRQSEEKEDGHASA